MKTILTFLSFVVLWSFTTALAETTKHAVNGTYGCRRSFGYGVYNASAKKTVICWNGDKMSIYVREFDHETEKWSDMVKAHALNYDRKNDYHNYPCIALAPDGHYLIFYFRHSRSAYMVKSPGPDTIHGKWTHKKLSDDKCAYPMPVLFGDTIYLCYSSTVAHWHRPYRMIKSTDSGETWSEPVTLIDSGHRQKEKYDEVYAHGFSVDKGDNDQAARILLGWEMASGPRGHNKGGYGNFFAYFNCKDQKMYTAGDKNLGATVDLEEMYSDCIINDAKSPDSRLFGYTTFPEVLRDGSIGVLYSLKGKSFVANWKNDSWKTTEIDVGGGIDDFQRTASGSYVVLSGNNKGITVWESRNGVTSWKKRSVTELPVEEGSDSSAKGFIEGFDKEVQWMASTFNRDNRKKDYSGKWPVYTFGVSSRSKADRTGHSKQGAEGDAVNRAP
jgi:hypothetical protein